MSLEEKKRKMTHPTSQPVNTQTSIFQLRDNIKQKSKIEKIKKQKLALNLGDYIKPKDTQYNKDNDIYVFNPDKYPYNIKRKNNKKSKETQLNKDEDIHNIICENENIEVRVRRKTQTTKNTLGGGKRQTTKRTLRKYMKIRNTAKNRHK